MGICASCLGRRGEDSYDEDDLSRLLSDEANNNQYGSFGDQHLHAQADPLESQRETEALQRVVARTSNNLVDVFEVVPQEAQRLHPAMLSRQDMRVSRYQNILAKLSSDDGSDEADPADVSYEWTVNDDEDNIELQHGQTTIKEAGGPLVGTFADAAKALA
ncbi:late endosomal/lysosomal adaptor and MAPK and MTOR activator-domain-containing protein [Microdochium trichocladiopsis]|uniref:Late endosomal/lysosomal adaptor and MAPK and MTOR activator-domain-containing protein n=1 Tax=Microdochium trichocladiopsis TaxID=1682393 RepID=A0A9P8Y3S9_9PEZI|nr:late endosomal/lysosomal adaptor and MAPK and MTOR activator-domain-containing protein [Microdochium trichocladiopsis]KAH7027989.1 late endosomal/lysosomal adaptor and MAPK and MTOR activator-domain-containing protein [Microdochium trichocladiopsis]